MLNCAYLAQLLQWAVAYGARLLCELEQSRRGVVRGHDLATTRVAVSDTVSISATDRDQHRLSPSFPAVMSRNATSED